MGNGKFLYLPEWMFCEWSVTCRCGTSQRGPWSRTSRVTQTLSTLSVSTETALRWRQVRHFLLSTKFLGQNLIN